MLLTARKKRFSVPLFLEPQYSTHKTVPRPTASSTVSPPALLLNSPILFHPALFFNFSVRLGSRLIPHPTGLRYRLSHLVLISFVKDNFHSLIVTLLQILSSNNDVQIKIYIADILSNLSCENQANKSIMIENNAVQLLVNIIIQNDNRDDIIESAVS